MVPRLSPCAGKAIAPPQGCIRYDLCSARRSARTRTATQRRVQDSGFSLSHQLLGMSSMNTRKDLSPELAALQGALGPARGKTYWRTLEELADNDAFRQLMQ